VSLCPSCIQKACTSLLLHVNNVNGRCHVVLHCYHLCIRKVCVASLTLHVEWEVLCHHLLLHPEGVVTNQWVGAMWSASKVASRSVVASGSCVVILLMVSCLENNQPAGGNVEKRKNHPRHGVAFLSYVVVMVLVIACMVNLQWGQKMIKQFTCK